MLSSDVIIWDENTPLFYFSWKLHSLTFDGSPTNRVRELNFLMRGAGYISSVSLNMKFIKKLSIMQKALV